MLKDIWIDKLIYVMVATSESEHNSQWSPEECDRVVRDRLAVLLLGVVVLYEVVQQGEDPEDAQHEEQLREQNLRGWGLFATLTLSQILSALDIM